jgi:uncharacterized protein
MILIDANLLIYAVNKDAPLHSEAKAWLESALTGRETVGLAWSVLLAFLRLTTRPGAFGKPLKVETALSVVEAWLNQPNVVTVEPTPAHFRTLRDLILPLGTAGNLTSDAHLAALALEHGAELLSTDHDFARFTRLNWRDPVRG